jgi:hypothetical protein
VRGRREDAEDGVELAAHCPLHSRLLLLLLRIIARPVSDQRWEEEQDEEEEEEEEAEQWHLGGHGSSNDGVLYKAKGYPGQNTLPTGRR